MKCLTLFHKKLKILLKNSSSKHQGGYSECVHTLCMPWWVEKGGGGRERERERLRLRERGGGEREKKRERKDGGRQKSTKVYELCKT